MGKMLVGVAWDERAGTRQLHTVRLNTLRGSVGTLQKSVKVAIVVG
jgi:hypothetical protein